MGFFSRLEARVRQTGSLLCVGLDPHLPDLPRPDALAARDFCLNLIDATADLAAAFKPNAAFFEVFGSEGIKVLAEVIQAVPKDIPVILDAKRGDIASTAQAYAQAAFKTFSAHAVTISPYLGYDSLQPFLEDSQRGVFLLCKTSNPGAADLQDLLVGQLPEPLSAFGRYQLYQVVAMLAETWNKTDNLGLVVGATHPDALEKVRHLAPNLWILSPGVGAQGATLQDALRAGLREDGLGLLIPISRGISRAADPHGAACEFVQRIQEESSHVRQYRRAQKKSGKFSEGLRKLADSLLQAGCVKFGEFRLKSGLISPVYLDLRQLVSFPKILERVAEAYLEILKDLDFERLAALPYAALPIGTAISLLGNFSMIYPRKELKDYGTRADIEGIYQDGDKIVIIDDLATTGGSKFEAIEKLTSAGLIVKDVVVLIDRQSGAAQALQEKGCSLHAVFTLTELLDYWEASGQVPATRIQAARDFLNQF